MKRTAFSGQNPSALLFNQFPRPDLESGNESWPDSSSLAT